MSSLPTRNSASTSNFADYEAEPFPSAIPLYANQGGQRLVGWIARDTITKSVDLIDKWKVSDTCCRVRVTDIPDPCVELDQTRARNPSACTQTYLFLPASSEDEADSMRELRRDSVLRFLVWLRKVSQHATRSTSTPAFHSKPGTSTGQTPSFTRSTGFTKDEHGFIDRIDHPPAERGAEGR